jgi:hypothetical protein
MKTRSFLQGLAAAMIFSTPTLTAQEMPEMPKPQSEHKWLQQLAGEWASEMECTMEPGKPPMKNKMTEKARSIGGFWLVSEGSGEAMGTPFSSILTLGYDTEKKKFIGTWVDSMTSTIWNYEGTLAADGKTLTLNTEGPCPMQGGKVCKFKEVIVFQDKDHRTFTSSVQGEDGTWTTIMNAKSTRIK